MADEWLIDMRISDSICKNQCYQIIIIANNFINLDDFKQMHVFFNNKQKGSSECKPIAHSQ